MKKMYQPNTQRSFGKKDIATGLALLAMAGVSVFGVSSAIKDRAEDKRVLQSYHGLETYKVQTGDTYWDFVVRDRDEFPRLREVPMEQLVDLYESFNDNTSMKDGQVVYRPNWENQ